MALYDSDSPAEAKGWLLAALSEADWRDDEVNRGVNCQYRAIYPLYASNGLPSTHACMKMTSPSFLLLCSQETSDLREVLHSLGVLVPREGCRARGTATR